MTKINLLERLDFVLTPEMEELFETYQKLFLEYNSHTNLISKNDEKVLFEKHIFDSLAINKFKKINECKTLMDIGTGGGFPAVPIALAFDIDVLGVDSVNKKINFINGLAEKMELKNLKAVCSRTEDLPKNHLESYDIVTSRAVAPLNVILEYAVPYIKVGGYFAAYKSQLVQEEMLQAQNALKVLNCSIADIIDYELPLEENFDRKLVIIKKNCKTPREFPRKAGIAKHNPL